jgi:ABC-type sugar transport system substrate-binding protein
MRRAIAAAALAAAALLALTGPASAAAGKGLLYHDGDIVRTVVNSGAIPHQGTDPFYSVTNGVAEQLGIAGEAPGDVGYNGGSWAVNDVTFNEGVEPYLLTSDEAVMQAESDGDVTVVRNPAADFRCPVQP